ncbi:hypothetical protein [Orrella sp. 11846]|uniref:hypothetical protein n=1 Tax=Orrella sp. 11846 TaxID=3409913 RepID=UPI003B591B22
MTKNQKPNWNNAPEDWDWLAQDADGRWFWYAVEPIPGVGGGVWRSPRLKQEFALQGEPNEQWLETRQKRPDATD